ncbi:MAG TPA: hypothetical protein VEK34_06535 [Methylocella sp.]|nr:hypothetical protein [Methylocella sp.]
MSDTITRETSTWDGFADAIGGMATVVLAIIGLAGIRPGLFISIAVIVFGVALLIQGGTMLSEYVQITMPSGRNRMQVSGAGGGENLATVFLAGAAGVILGILSVLAIRPEILTSISIIAFGAATLLSSASVGQLGLLKQAAVAADEEGTANAASQAISMQVTSATAGVQALAGLAVAILGILALVGVGVDSAVLILAALIVAGCAIVLTGGALTSSMVGHLGEERQYRPRPGTTVAPPRHPTGAISAGTSLANNVCSPIHIAPARAAGACRFRGPDFSHARYCSNLPGCPSLIYLFTS